MDEQIPILEIKKYVLPIVNKYLDLATYRLFVFGSRATGTAEPTSDIDIGIQGPRPVPRHLLAALREDIKETPLIYKVDIVDISSVSSNFRHLATNNARIINP